MKTQILTLTVLLFSLLASGQHYYLDGIAESNSQEYTIDQALDRANNMLEKSREVDGCLRDSTVAYVDGELSSRTYYYYNEEGQQIEMTLEFWTGSEWEFSSRSINEYNDQEDLELTTDQTWEDGEWGPFYQVDYFYEGGILVSTVFESWDAENWVINYRTVPTYSDGVMTILSVEIWEDDEWVITSQTLLDYDGDGNLSEELSQSNVNDAWTNSSLRAYSYDENGWLVLDQYLYWSQNSWQNIAQYTHANDDSGNNVEIVGENWDDDMWAYSLKFDFTHDIHGNVLTEFLSLWNGTDWDLAKFETFHYYDCTNVNIEESSALSSFNVYPNPTPGQVNLTFDEKVSVQVFNSRGILVNDMHAVSQGRTQLYLPAAQGLYIIKAMNANGAVSTARIIRE